MTEEGKWYVTIDEDDRAMYYYVFIAKDDAVYTAVFFESGELFEYDIYDNFGHDGLSDFIPPHNKEELFRNAIAVMFEYMEEYAGDYL